MPLAGGYAFFGAAAFFARRRYANIVCYVAGAVAAITISCFHWPLTDCRYYATPYATIFRFH